MGGAFVFPFGGTQDGWPPCQGHSWTLRRTWVVTVRVSTHDVPATTRSPYCTLTLNPPRRGLSHPLFTDEETEADRAGNQPKTIQRVSGTPGIQTPLFWFQSHYTVLPYVSAKLRYPSELPGGLYNTDSQAPACISAGEVCFLQHSI